MAAPVNNRDQRDFVRPADGDSTPGAVCDIGAFEAAAMAAATRQPPRHPHRHRHRPQRLTHADATNTPLALTASST